MTTPIRLWKCEDSSNVEAVGYDGESKFEVKFKNGGHYRYDGVPPQMAMQIITAKSVGSCIAELLVKSKIPFAKLEAPKEPALMEKYRSALQLIASLEPTLGGVMSTTLKKAVDAAKEALS